MKRNRPRVITSMMVILTLMVSMFSSYLVEGAETDGDNSQRHGLKGDYYVSSGEGAFDFHEHKATVVDRNINFGDLNPILDYFTGQGDHATVRWTGQIKPEYSEEYTFSMFGDNGFRLWIDGELVIDHWVNDWNNEQVSEPIALEAGKKYDIKVEYFDDVWGAHLKLLWYSDSQVKEVVPAENLYLPEGFEDGEDTPPPVTTYPQDFDDGEVGGWEVQDGFADIEVANKALKVAPKLGRPTIIDEGSPEYANAEYETKLKVGSNGGKIGFLFRYTDLSNYAGVSYDSGKWIWLNGKGEFGTLTTKGPDLEAGKTYQIKIRYHENHVMLWVDGERIFSGILAHVPLSAGKIGMIAGQNTKPFFLDNIDYEKYTAPKPSPEKGSMSVWTASSYKNIFQDSVKPGGAKTSIDWVVARNEFESAQIVLRNDSNFKINNVTFSNLKSGSDKIESSNLEYNFVDYVFTSENTLWQNDSSVVRSAPGFFPDPLSNEAMTEVAGDTTQPIWVTLYVPKTAAAGVYTGMATVHTSQGPYKVNLSAEVNDVTIPDSDDAHFKTMHWQQIGGTWHFDSYANSHPNDNIRLMYGHKRWTAEWWDLVEDMAQKMKDYRTNALFVNTQKLLLDGGTTIDSKGNYDFNWSKFDEYIQFFIDQGVVKSLESHALTRPIYGNTFEMYLIKNDKNGIPMTTTVEYGTAASEMWVNQFIPALYDHLQQKGWLDMWMQSIGDEPHAQEQQVIYSSLLDKFREYAPEMKVGDAFNGVFNYMKGKVDIYVPNVTTYQSNKPAFEELKDNGKEVYIYTANVPGGDWLNRFVDKPVWQMRSLGWLAYKWGVSGFLHWGWNYWFNEPYNPKFLSVDDDSWKGDHYTVYPDVGNNQIKASIRYAANRDASEDFEIFKILEEKDPIKAKNIAGSIAPDALHYSTDIQAMIAKRNQLVRAAGDDSEKVSYWNLNKGSGAVVEDSWANADGHIIGRAEWTNNGKDGRALVFDGADDGIYVGHKPNKNPNGRKKIIRPNIPGPWTVSMWVKREKASSATATLLGSQGAALNLETGSTNKIGLTNKELDNFTFNYEAPIGQWTKLTFVGKAKETSLYVNGEFQDTVSAAINLPFMTIGYKYDQETGNNENFLKGTLDEVKVYKRVLTPAEITNTKLKDGSITNWQFDGTSDLVHDSWNGYTGTLNGGVSRAEGKINNALVFNGEDGRMDIEMADLSVPWTASMWVRKDANQISSALMSSMSAALKLGQWPNTNTVGLSQWGYFDTTFDYSAPTGTWVHLTFIGTNSETSLYVNGKLEDTNDHVIPLPMDTVGYRRTWDGKQVDFLKGAIDELKVYNRALEPSEISRLAKSQR